MTPSSGHADAAVTRLHVRQRDGVGLDQVDAGACQQVGARDRRVQVDEAVVVHVQHVRRHLSARHVARRDQVHVARRTRVQRRLLILMIAHRIERDVVGVRRRSAI